MTNIEAQSQYLTEMHRQIEAAHDGMSILAVADQLEGDVFDTLDESLRDELWHHIERKRLTLLRKTGAGTP